MGTFWKDGYSATVDIYLLVGGKKLSVAQVGPNYLRLQKLQELPLNTDAELVIHTDDQSILYPIHIERFLNDDFVGFSDLPSSNISASSEPPGPGISQQLMLRWNN